MRSQRGPILGERRGGEPGHRKKHCHGAHAAGDGGPCRAGAAGAGGAHFGSTRISIDGDDPARGATTIRCAYVTLKSVSTGPGKKLSGSASSSGSTLRMYGPGGRRAITNSPAGVSVKLPISTPVSGLKATTCAPWTP